MSGVTLFRPVGEVELGLIADSGWTRFPPRLPEQPIFYPVMNFDYAEQIARDWNSKHEPTRTGYVLAMDMRGNPTGRWPVQIAGGSVHKELWVPAEELDDFNDLIEAPIRLVATYRDGAMVEKSA